MSAKSELELIGVIEKQLVRLEALCVSITQAYERDVAVLGRTGNAAVMIAGLLELQRFRHLKRYYFDLDYDWDRLDFLRALGS